MDCRAMRVTRMVPVSRQRGDAFLARDRVLSDQQRRKFEQPFGVAVGDFSLSAGLIGEFSRTLWLDPPPGRIINEYRIRSAPAFAASAEGRKRKHSAGVTCICWVK